MPTVAEAGFPGHESAAFAGIVAPAGTPPEALVRFHAAMTKAMTPDMRARFIKDGIDLRPSPSAPQFNEFIAQAVAKYSKVVKDAGIIPAN